MEEKIKSKEEIIEILRFAIDTTSFIDPYDIGLRNGLRFAISCLNDAEPEYEQVEDQSAWKLISPAKIYECPICGQTVMTDDICTYRYCHGCGAKMEYPEENND